MKNIGLIGIGHIGKTCTTFLQTTEQDPIVVSFEMNSEQVIDRFTRSMENPYIIKTLIAEYTQEKQFICKGKHQYENRNGSWVCQCGRNIKN